ncbi:MAG: hypothetical protein KIH65_001820 [Candidatus Uhrbacteria bacterium]|nr:hypothetical protein [Candidatus Uhrbacteria bacterium]
MPKLTPKDISALLEELYATDPSLRDREADLKRLIQTLAAAKPNAVVDSTFIQTLRKTLAEKAKTLSVQRTPSMKISLPTIHSSRFWPALGFTVSGVAVGMMAMLYVTQDMGISSTLRMKPVATQNENTDFATRERVLSIERIANGAFGQLAVNAGVTQEMGVAPSSGMGGNAVSYEARSLAMPIAASEAPVPRADGAVTSGVASPDMKMIAPYPMVQVDYEYTGEALDLTDTSLDVLKRSPGSFSGGSLVSALRGLNLGVADLSSFGNASVGDISIYQNEPYGYQIYVSPRSGTISIDQNWDQWKDAYPTCQDDQCWKASQLKRSDVPSDQELVQIADAFIAQHRIDRSVYGAGEVDKSWEQYASNENGEVYIPDVMQVTYPLMIDGKTVYQNGGAKMGIVVGINLRVKKVSSVYNLQQLSFEASAYDAETNADTILAEAKKGGLSSPIRYMQENVETKTVKAELGTPMKALVQIYQYKDNQSFELYVPALIFPVTKAPDVSSGAWAPSAVIVPLVKGIVQDMPTIMPLIESGAMIKSGDGASGSSGGMVTPPAMPSVVSEPDTKR